MQSLGLPLPRVSSWSIHPQAPVTLAFLKPSPQFLKPISQQLSAEFYLLEIGELGNVPKEKGIYSCMALTQSGSFSQESHPLNVCLLLAALLCLQTMFLKYFVQNLYCYWWECYAATTYSVTTESQTLTQNVFKENEVSLFLVHIKFDAKDTAIKTLRHLFKSVEVNRYS